MIPSVCWAELQRQERGGKRRKRRRREPEALEKKE
jgi:hypothetical protein